jgi:hypothetical protein
LATDSGYFETSNDEMVKKGLKIPTSKAVATVKGMEWLMTQFEKKARSKAPLHAHSLLDCLDLKPIQKAE